MDVDSAGLKEMHFHCSRACALTVVDSVCTTFHYTIYSTKNMTISNHLNMGHVVKIDDSDKYSQLQLTTLI